MIEDLDIEDKDLEFIYGFVKHNYPEKISLFHIACFSYENDLYKVILFLNNGGIDFSDVILYNIISLELFKFLINNLNINLNNYTEHQNIFYILNNLDKIKYLIENFNLNLDYYIKNFIEKDIISHTEELKINYIVSYYEYKILKNEIQNEIKNKEKVKKI